MHKKETDTIHVSQCVTMLKNSRFARLIAAPNFLNSDFLAGAKKKGWKLLHSARKRITCSWHQKTKPRYSRIHQFVNLNCCIKAREPFKTLFNGVLFHIYYFKKHFKPCFFILKTFCSSLNLWIRGFNFWYHEQVLVICVIS